MKIRRVVFPLYALGPGDRVGLWLTGCPHDCPGCCSPDLKHQVDTDEVDEAVIVDLLQRAADLDGLIRLTISGGEPFSQAESLAHIIKSLNDAGYRTETLVYTGYTLDQLKNNIPDKFANNLLRVSDILVDGSYLADFNDGSPLRGSSNQNIHFLGKTDHEEWKSYMAEGRQIQAFSESNMITFLGIPPKFKEE